MKMPAIIGTPTVWANYIAQTALATIVTRKQFYIA